MPCRNSITLEANYGSFIRGAMANTKEPKTDRDRPNKKVFSAVGGLSQMVDAIPKDLISSSMPIM